MSTGPTVLCQKGSVLAVGNRCKYPRCKGHCWFSQQAFYDTVQVDVPAEATEAFVCKHYIDCFVLFNVLAPKVDGMINAMPPAV